MEINSSSICGIGFIKCSSFSKDLVVSLPLALKWIDLVLNVDTEFWR